MVYVDDMRAQFGRMVMCHMIADATKELHAMADRIGVSRRWCQHEGTYREHYDICLSKRALAIEAGAVEISQRTLGQLIKARRLVEQGGVITKLSIQVVGEPPPADDGLYYKPGEQ